MLNRVYSIFDKRIRPLRNHVYLAFPKHGLAYARVAEPAFQLLRPLLHRLAGTEALLSRAGVGTCPTKGTERLLFHGDVELLTARELKRRYPEMKVVAWVQDPAHRIAYCFEKIILNSDPIPAYYAERYFTNAMSADAFVSQIASISDLEADNLFRSQCASLTYKGVLTADVVWHVENFEQSLADFYCEHALGGSPLPAASYQPSHFASRRTLQAFGDEGLLRKLKRRYRADYEMFYSREAVSA
ncbi:MULTISPECIES: hypothetical protein [unclassified Roseibium]|uniref:hypothetical protein n=1 Tax=unclassified Roseibium TaxID=2629323 RepID=UPI003179431B